MKLTLYHLYPDLLDLYGDGGNALALVARAKWRGIELEVHPVPLDGELDFSQADIILIGGGSDREQSLLVEDLEGRKAQFQEAIEDGLVVLSICGGYQLLGQYYETIEGMKIPGLGLLDFYTVAGNKRLISNVIIQMSEGLNSAVREKDGSLEKHPLSETAFQPGTLVGFENHSGKTYLGRGLTTLGKVIRGYGNNGEDGQEGMRYKNVFGTYLHGPFLPKNPHIADLLLSLALKRNGTEAPLAPLDDSLEKAAHEAIIKRFGTG